MTDEVQLRAPPILSTPESHAFEDPGPLPTISQQRFTDEDIWSFYEVERTAKDIRDGRWKRIALQFPDHMLGDAVRVFEGLHEELEKLRLTKENVAVEEAKVESLQTSYNNLLTSTPVVGSAEKANVPGNVATIQTHRLSILGDTSYGACCVDEIAAEHVDAEVVVHYGRSCLSPTTRLPVLYVFTSRPLKIDDVVAAFENTYVKDEGKKERVILMADIVYHSHIQAVLEALEEAGWENIIAPEVVHDPSSLIPNRKVEMAKEELKNYSVFHISDPPPALLLTLSSRVKDLHIYPTITTLDSPTKTLQSNSRIALRRRYALLTSLSTCGIFGILVNTLSVRNYLATVTAVRDQIAAAGKKSYTFVVGKVNAAKIANFSEIGGWVVIGCWESSLIESAEFYKPIITPFELELCLMADRERIWNGSWSGDLESLKVGKPAEVTSVISGTQKNGKHDPENDTDLDGGALDSEEESEPPEFDLRTGRYVSNSRPMRSRMASSPANNPIPSTEAKQDIFSTALARRAKLDVTTVNGAVSPGAEYLRNQRTWTGLGSDFSETEASENVEEGRTGVARGYVVGNGAERR